MPQIADYQISLKAILKNSLWETLILKTLETSWFYWKCDLPGGRINETEFEVPYLDILAREIKEEIWDVKVDLKNKVVAIGRHSHKWKIIFYIVFEWIILDEENIKISHEHCGYEFVNLENIVLQNYFTSWILESIKIYLNK